MAVQDPTTPAPSLTPGQVPNGGPSVEERMARLERDNAILRATQQYPTLTEDILKQFRGSPDEMMTFAKTIHERYGAAAPAPPSPSPGAAAPAAAPAPAVPGQPPVVPTPTPGVQPPVAQDALDSIRMRELRDKVLNKQANFAEADELYRLTTKDAFKQHSRAVQGQGYGPRVKRGGGMVELERTTGAT